MRTVKEIKVAAEAWQKVSSEIHEYYPNDVIEKCDVLEALGKEWGYRMPYHFSVRKRPHVTNSSTHYDFDDDKYYVVWNNGNVGRYQFVDGVAYDYVDEEWEQFIAELDSYEPLDSDPYNDHKVYSIENGKRLMNDYEDICKRTREAMNKKIKKCKFERLKKELEKLEAEEYEIN